MSNLVHLLPAEAPLNLRFPANYRTDPAEQARELAEAAPFWTDENAPHVNTQPREWRAYRQQISRNEWWQAVACAVLLAVLIGLMITPDTAVVQAQMEDAQ